MTPTDSSPLTSAFAPISGGWFIMGTDRGQEDERPPHRVFVDPFELAVFPVTRAEYVRFVNASGHEPPRDWSHPPFAQPDLPVVGVSWLDAVDYCAWQSQEDRRPVRLPTEAEWEFAARGGLAQQPYPWGDAAVTMRQDYATRWCEGPEPVATSEPNGFGLFDMCENVHEWCSDWYDPLYYAVSPVEDPRGPVGGTRRASRGGAWRHHIKIARCAARSSIPPEFRYADYGFRVAV